MLLNDNIVDIKKLIEYVHLQMRVQYCFYFYQSCVLNIQDLKEPLFLYNFHGISICLLF